MAQPTFVYAGGRPVQVGDQVLVKRWFRKAEPGVVISVFDPMKPSEPRGGNDWGFTVRLAGGRYIFSSHNPDPRIIFRSPASDDDGPESP